MRPSHHRHVGVGYFQVLKLGGHHEVPQRGIHPPYEVLITGRPDGLPLSRSPGANGRLAVIISALSTLPPMAISILTTSGSRFVGRGVKGDSQSCRLTQWLHCLLVWGYWLTPGRWEWLVQGWHHLRSLQCQNLQCQSLQCHSLPVQSSSHVCSPPNGRSVLWGYR